MAYHCELPGVIANSSVEIDLGILRISVAAYLDLKQAVQPGVSGGPLLPSGGPPNRVGASAGPEGRHSPHRPAFYGTAERRPPARVDAVERQPPDPAAICLAGQCPRVLERDRTGLHFVTTGPHGFPPPERTLIPQGAASTVRCGWSGPHGSRDASARLGQHRQCPAALRPQGFWEMT